jgi:lysophospholipase L1-like esterase
VVVYYCGSNDVDAGEPADAIVARIRRFVDRVLEASPTTRLVFVSVNRAPEKRDRWDVVDAVNRQIAAYGQETGRLIYVDVNPTLVDARGEPRLDLFMPDQLHLRPPAYEAFARILKPVLERAYANR